MTFSISGKLELNKRLSSSFHMFGIKGESDFLYPCSMIYNKDSGYKLIRKKQDNKLMILWLKVQQLQQQTT